MTNCNRCTDPFELWEWKQIDTKWKLCNPYTGNPHVCKNNVKAEISADIKPVQHRSGKQWSPHVGEYQYGDLATPDTNSLEYCDKCGNEISVKGFGLDGVTEPEKLTILKQEAMIKYQCQCLLLNRIDCYQFCNKCNIHPQVIVVTTRKAQL